MPQFDFNTYTSQVFWLLLCFGALIGLMTRYFLPNFYKTLKNREQKVKKNLDQIQSLQEQIDNLVSRREKTLQDLHLNLEKSLHNMVQAMESNHEKQKQQIEEEIKGAVQKLHEEFQGQKLKIIDNMEPILKECVQEILNKIGFKKDECE